MLTAQAVFAAEHFTGKTLPAGTIDRVYNEIKAQKQNLVLIGMPGSGKSTLGSMVAENLGFEFLDTDCIITENEGRTPAEIISEDGEEAFRKIETAAVKQAAARQGVVIATGGGAVLRPENLSALRENGKIIFLDRKVEHLVTSSDRPLSSNREKLWARYRERYPIYCAAADQKVTCVREKEANVKRIKEAFLK